jgi:hypothetical protein
MARTLRSGSIRRVKWNAESNTSPALAWRRGECNASTTRGCYNLRAIQQLANVIKCFRRHCYEIYLTHEFVVVWMIALYAKPHAGSVLVWIGAEVVLTALRGWLVARWFSEPMNQRLRGL